MISYPNKQALFNSLESEFVVVLNISDSVHFSEGSFAQYRQPFKI